MYFEFIQDWLSAGSATLFSSTGGLAYLAEATILLPESWEEALDQGTVDAANRRENEKTKNRSNFLLLETRELPHKFTKLHDFYLRQSRQVIER